jgi:hypothetical protein
MNEDGALFPRLAWVTPLHPALYGAFKNADTHMALFTLDLNTKHKRMIQTFSSCAPASFVHVCNPLRAYSRALYHVYAGINTIASQILARFSCTSVGLLPLARSLRIS